MNRPRKRVCPDADLRARRRTREQSSRVDQACTYRGEFAERS